MSPSLAFLLGVTDEDAGAALAGLVRDALGVTVAGPATVAAFDYAYDSPATGGLFRVTGTADDGALWSLFCKVLQHVRHWPGLQFMPEEIRAVFPDQLPWRAELELWDPAQLATLPDGLRAPALYRLADLGDDRLGVWQEDVQHDHATWDLARYERAAGLLGRWNARATTPAALAVVDHLPPGYALRMYATNAVRWRGLSLLAADEVWEHPWLGPHADLRAELLRLGDRIPDLLDSLDAMTQCAPHGDASPQNLLCPLEDPDAMVTIDLSFRSSHALGFDLGQLLVGLVHAGLQPAAAMPDIARTILAAYLGGVREEGVDVPDDELAHAFAISVLLRSGFDGFRYDLLEASDPADRPAFDQRVAMSRFLVDQFNTLVG